MSLTLALPTSSREIHLASRPVGRPVPENFRLAESLLPELQDGQILVRNLYISVDPYMRGRMNDVKSYSAPFALDAALDGGAIGEVIASRAEGRKVGTPSFISWAGGNSRSWTQTQPRLPARTLRRRRRSLVRWA
ncbi:putative NADP-dependent oxidoreductase YfmJ [Arthrobacter sp. Hiyo4]|nr:putative NADP-dependent oxidoreductase YfmJ [Arthrobacter sp. Hiyo4]